MNVCQQISRKNKMNVQLMGTATKLKTLLNTRKKTISRKLCFLSSLHQKYFSVIKT